MSLPDGAAEKLRVAFALHEAGVAMMRENLRRRFPEAPSERIDEMLVAWLQERPGAEHGDGVGIPSTRFVSPDGDKPDPTPRQ